MLENFLNSRVTPTDILDKVDFDRMSNFAVHPNQVDIAPGAESIVNIIFAPRQGGDLEQKCKANFRYVFIVVFF